MDLASNGGEPSRRPCGSCPYRRDVPSGVWDREEYDKLPPYDLSTGEQPPQAFFCHQRDGRLCAGWVAVHDMQESLGLRLAAEFGLISADAASVCIGYSTDVELFSSGAEAAAHGLDEVAAPGREAVRLIEKLGRRST